MVPLSDRVPDLAALEMLLAVARTGSLNAASRQLGITQQAVSARVRSVESRAGVALIARTARGSTLTPEGVVVAEWAARLLAVAGELDTGLAAFRGDHQMRLRVSASLTIAEQLLPGWLVCLQAAAQQGGQPTPQILLTAANSDTVTAQVRAGAADLGFVEGQPARRACAAASSATTSWPWSCAPIIHGPGAATRSARTSSPPPVSSAGRRGQGPATCSPPPCPPPWAPR